MLVDYDAAVSPFHAQFEFEYNKLADLHREDGQFLYSLAFQGLSVGNPTIITQYQLAVMDLDDTFEYNVQVLCDSLKFKVRQARKQEKKARKTLAASKKAARSARYQTLLFKKNLRREFYVTSAKAMADWEYIEWMGFPPELVKSHLEKFAHFYMDYEDDS